MKKNLIILASAVISIAIYKLLPADKDVLKGLAILIFIGTLWISESLPITATALLVPIIAVMTGIFEVKQALSYFAHPIIYFIFRWIRSCSCIAQV